MAKKKRCNKNSLARRAKTAGGPKETLSLSLPPGKKKSPRGSQNHVPFSHGIEAALKGLQGRNRTIRSLQSQGKPPPVFNTVIDNGAQQCLIGTKEWRVTNRHDSWI